MIMVVYFCSLYVIYMWSPILVDSTFSLKKNSSTLLYITRYPAYSYLNTRKYMAVATIGAGGGQLPPPPIDIAPTKLLGN